MPTIEITDAQAQQLAQGESITLAPAPKPRPNVSWNVSFIPAGKSKQQWHTVLPSPGPERDSDPNFEDDAFATACKWVEGDSILGNDVRCYGGGTIAVCLLKQADNRPYTLTTMGTRYFRVDRNLTVTAGL